MKAQKFIFGMSIPILSGMLLICTSCEKGGGDNGEPEASVPFKSLSVEAQGETAQAEITGERALRFEFKQAEDFSSCRLKVELNKGYTLTYPTDPDNYDMATYPVITFASSSNKTIRYTVEIKSVGFPIEDGSKIKINGEAGGVTVNGSAKELVILFDKAKMDMSAIAMTFEEGALAEGASAEPSYTFDFTKGLVQPIKIKVGGGDRICNVRLDLSLVMANPQTLGFTDVTAMHLDTEAYPFINIYSSNNVLGVPVNNNDGNPEMPWYWDYSDENIYNYMSYIGDWKPEREKANLLGEFTIVTIDLDKVNGKIVTETGTLSTGRISIADVTGLITMTGLPDNDLALFYYDGQLIQDKVHNNTSAYKQPQWRAAIGFDAEGYPSITSTAYSEGKMMSLPFVKENDDMWASAKPWDVKSAVTGYPWAVRNGHKLTKNEALINDVAYDEALGQAWNGFRARGYVGLTYDNKLAFATAKGDDVSTWGIGTCQGAWVLDQLGWRDVLCLATSHYAANDFVPTIYVDGKPLSGKAGQEAKYCIAVDVKR